MPPRTAQLPLPLDCGTIDGDMTHSPDHKRRHVALLTAGGAGMFCGSCLHDNTWAHVLHDDGYEISLIPAYTPIRVDEENFSSRRVFFGGVNVYLDSHFPWWRRMPAWIHGLLDAPAFIRWSTSFGVSTEAGELGKMTVEMLQGEVGPHRSAVIELADYFHQLNPDVILFTNALLSGTLPRLKAVHPGRCLCILQGDDIFLEGLIEPYKTQAMDLIRQRISQFDGFVVHSRYYRDFMANYLRIPNDRFHLLPLTIDCQKHDGQVKPDLSDPPTIGFFARICQEKGLHRLVEACLLLRQKVPNFRLLAGGYLPRDGEAYLQSVRELAVPLGDDFQYIGSPETHAEKVDFLKSLDIFSLPTVYHEPKGLPALEALANGVPIVVPAHGAFPELVESSGGGLLFPGENPRALADCLEQLLTDAELRRRHAREGWTRVREAHGFPALAAASRRLLEPGSRP